MFSGLGVYQRFRGLGSSRLVKVSLPEPKSLLAKDFL
jgi:hypothetical protein